ELRQLQHHVERDQRGDDGAVRHAEPEHGNGIRVAPGAAGVQARVLTSLACVGPIGPWAWWGGARGPLPPIGPTLPNLWAHRSHPLGRAWDGWDGWDGWGGWSRDAAGIAPHDGVLSRTGPYETSIRVRRSIHHAAIDRSRRRSAARGSAQHRDHPRRRFG